MNRRISGPAGSRLAVGVLVVLGATALGATLAAARPVEPITFSGQIAPLLIDRCGGCHRPDGVAPFSVLTYAAVRSHARQVAAVTKSRVMPPWKSEPGHGEFVGQRPLTDAEIDLIQRWVGAGAIEGDPRDLPAQPRRTDGWQLGTPDLIISPPQPYMLRADGPDAFRLFVIPIPTAIARYVRGAELRPDNPRVVHHANILLDRTPTSRERNADDPTLGERGFTAGTAASPPGHFLSWAPGQSDALLPDGLSWRLEPGTDLVVQLHLKPSGKPEVVQFSVGFFFGADPPDRTPVVLRLGRQQIDIPAGERAYTITDAYVLPVDADVLALKPHAHYRGHDIQALATLPDGTKKWLLYIKDWDFRWQHVYRLVTPLALPAGTTLTMQMTYDNSASNPRNPEIPPRRVRWGPTATDEMGDMWVQVLPRDARDVSTLNRDFRRKWVAEDIAGDEALLEADPGNVTLHTDVALLHLELGHAKASVAHFAATVRLRPASADAHFNLGTALAQAGQLDEAIRQYQDALRINPDSAAAHNNLGSAFDEQGRVDEAVAQYRDALRLQPSHARAHNNLGFTLLKRGMIDESLVHFREALRVDPQLPSAHYNIGLALERRGAAAEAIAEFRTALQLQPDWAPVLADLAWVLATASDDRLRDGNEAVGLAERAVMLTERRDAEAMDVLGAAYAEARQFDRALDIVRQAIRLAPSALAARLREREALYTKSLPFRQPAGPR